MEITREVVLVVAMLCITALGVTALAMGFDGTLFTGVVGALVTIAGYLFTRPAPEPEEDEEDV